MKLRSPQPCRFVRRRPPGAGPCRRRPDRGTLWRTLAVTLTAAKRARLQGARPPGRPRSRRPARSGCSARSRPEAGSRSPPRLMVLDGTLRTRMVRRNTRTARIPQKARPGEARARALNGCPDETGHPAACSEHLHSADRDGPEPHVPGGGVGGVRGPCRVAVPVAVGVVAQVRPTPHDLGGAALRAGRVERG